MYAEQEVAAVLDQLAQQPELVEAIRQDPRTLTRLQALPYEIRRSVDANRYANLRQMISADDGMADVEMTYTKGDKCSTACTKAGCYTNGANCTSSQGGCTGVKPRC